MYHYQSGTSNAVKAPFLLYLVDHLSLESIVQAIQVKYKINYDEVYEKLIGYATMKARTPLGSSSVCYPTGKNCFYYVKKRKQSNNTITQNATVPRAKRKDKRPRKGKNMYLLPMLLAGL